MTDTVMLHVRVDEETKVRAGRALDAMGLSISDAVRVFLKRVAVEHAIPFAIKVPNATTRAAMEDARSIGEPRFAGSAAMFDDLDSKEQLKDKPATASPG